MLSSHALHFEGTRGNATQQKRQQQRWRRRPSGFAILERRLADSIAKRGKSAWRQAVGSSCSSRSSFAATAASERRRSSFAKAAVAATKVIGHYVTKPKTNEGAMHGQP